MAKINVLEKQVAELIAAGEVVERPASIVKELVENAADAGADSITVEIQGGGVRYIRVTDNGSGIERDDIANAFLRHATSKVRVQEDLSGIKTMGFRGEALASVAAMCRVEVLTRTKEEVAGTRYVISGGEQECLEDAGCPVGTTITVRDVFFNTPARMKFLKKDVSEGNSVAAVVEKAALSNPAASFRFIRDGQVRLQTPGDEKLISTVRCVLGKEFAENCIPVQYAVDGLSIDGCIGKPESARSSRSLQNFFINTRFVRSKTCMAALEEAYRNALMVGKFPFCVLNLTIPPHTVDVNVHPAKIEVRFADEKSIFNLVYYGCKTALGASKLQPELKASPVKYNPFAAKLEKEIPVQEHFSAAEYRAAFTPSPVTAREKSAEKPALPGRVLERTDYLLTPQKAGYPVSRPSLDVSLPDDQDAPEVLMVESEGISARYDRGELSPALTYTREVPPVPEAEIPPEPVIDIYENARLVGEVFDTFLILQNQNELYLVDKHAAHERLLFNRLMAGGIGEERQLLMSPVSVKLSQEEHGAVLENLALLEKAGILAEDFGDGYVVVREVAPVFSGSDLPAIVAEFSRKMLASSSRTTPQALENIYHMIACRAAVKARDKTPAPALEQLIALLREDGDANHCPHGRPVAVKMTRYEIEKRFGRLG